MITEYRHIVAGLPVMYLIVVVAMIAVVVAMCMDAMYGWRKAKERGEARTSYLFSRSINKFALYEGVMFISAMIDTLIHFVQSIDYPLCAACKHHRGHHIVHRRDLVDA